MTTQSRDARGSRLSSASRLKSRLFWGILLGSCLPLVCIVVVCSFTLHAHQVQLLEQRVTETNHQSARQIQAYFDGLRRELALLAQNYHVVTALDELSRNASSVLSENEISPQQIEEYRRELHQFHQANFVQNFRSQTGQETSLAWIELLSPESVILQHLYLVRNSHPMGARDLFGRPSDTSRFSELHQRHHPHLRDLVQGFGAFDLYLIDNQGTVVYSTYKEVDFGTCVLDGPFARSGLGNAFEDAQRARQAGQVFVADFAPYEPLANLPAGFIACPVFRQEQRLGVVVVQLSLTGVKAALNRPAHLGVTAESRLCDANNKLLVSTEPQLAVAEPERKHPPSLLEIPVPPTSATPADHAFVASTRVQLSGAEQPRSVNWNVTTSQSTRELKELATEQGALGALVFTWAVTVLVSILIVNWLTDRGVRQLREVSRVLDSLDSGDQQARANVMTRDECGELAEQLNKLCDREFASNMPREQREKVTQSVLKLMDVIQAVGQGDLRGDCPVPDDLTGTIGAALGEMIDKLRAQFAFQKVIMSEASESFELALNRSTEMAHEAKAQQKRVSLAMLQLDSLIRNTEFLIRQVACFAEAVEVLRKSIEGQSAEFASAAMSAELQGIRSELIALTQQIASLASENLDGMRAVHRSMTQVSDATVKTQVGIDEVLAAHDAVKAKLDRSTGRLNRILLEESQDPEQSEGRDESVKSDSPERAIDEQEHEVNMASVRSDTVTLAALSSGVLGQTISQSRRTESHSQLSQDMDTAESLLQDLSDGES